MEHGPSWIHSSLIYLGAAVLAVPLARLLGLGSIIGYLAAGIAIGPWGLKLVTDPQAMLHFAEFGVVLMLFLVGLELEPRRLWQLRRPIFGWGSVQLFGSAALMTAAGVAAGLDWHLALVAGLGLGMSSTAIGLSVLNERNLMATSAGQSVLSVALLQDIAAIPILAIVPLLALQGATATDDGNGWVEGARALGVIVAIVFGGRLLLRPALRWIARSDTPEIFTAASLLLVVATAALMQSVGLSMALGAFLAGVLLAESEYRRELETDIEPFKGLLLGLFFIAVGMSIDFGVVLRQPGLVAAVVLGFLLLKAVVLWAMARLMPLPAGERPVFVILLAQGGEFGFVVFQSALGARVITPETSSLLVAAVAVSMLLTPLLLLAADRWTARQARLQPLPEGLPELRDPQHAPVIIAGFGRYGQIVGRLLSANGHSATVLDHSVENVEGIRRFGWPAFYGDATRLDLVGRGHGRHRCTFLHRHADAQATHGRDAAALHLTTGGQGLQPAGGQHRDVEGFTALDALDQGPSGVVHHQHPHAGLVLEAGHECGDHAFHGTGGQHFQHLGKGRRGGDAQGEAEGEGAQHGEDRSGSVVSARASLHR